MGQRASPRVWSCLPASAAYYDFVASSDLAESAVPAEVIDFGTPSARRYMGAGWSGQDERWAGGWSFVWATEDASTLRFHAFGDGIRALRFSCRPATLPDGEPQSVTLALNGTDLGVVTLEPGRQTYRVPVPAGAIKTGENALEIRYRIRTARSASDTRRRAVAWDWLRFVGAAAVVDPFTDDGSLAIPLNSRMDYFVDVRPGSSLWLQSTATANHPDSRLLVETLDSEQRTAAAEYDGGELGQGVELAVAGSGPMRVSFRVTADPAGRGVRVHQARLRSPASNRSAAHIAPDRSIVLERPPHIIVYVVDTLRADHLGTYGYGLPTSPRLDAFAADAVVFERGYAHSGWTRTSVASLLSGLNPMAHGVMEREHPLPAPMITLPAVMADLGFETVGIVTNGILAPAFGFDNGFDTYQYLPEQDPEKQPEVHWLSDEVNTRFFEWLDDRSGESPFFAYLHTTDPHSPYTPRSPYRERFLGDRPSSGLVWPRYADRFVAGQDEVTEVELRDELMALYDAEVAFNDEQFGRLLEGLRARDLYDETVIVFTSDHGEEFLDHGQYSHGRTLYREMIHVPFIVRLPGGVQGGLRSSATARHIDLLPTLTELAGAEAPPWAQGRSLVPALSDEKWSDGESARAYLQLDSISVASFVAGGWHLLRAPMTPEYPSSLSLELFDWGADAGEQMNLRDAQVARAGLLMTHWLQLDARETPLFAVGSAEIDPELAARLRDLGYIR